MSSSETKRSIIKENVISERATLMSPEEQVIANQKAGEHFRSAVKKGVGAFVLLAASTFSAIHATSDEKELRPVIKDTGTVSQELLPSTRATIASIFAPLALLGGAGLAFSAYSSLERRESHLEGNEAWRYEGLLAKKEPKAPIAEAPESSL